MVTDVPEPPILSGMGMPLASLQPSRPASIAGLSGFSFGRNRPVREQRGQERSGPEGMEEAPGEPEATETEAEEGWIGQGKSRLPNVILQEPPGVGHVPGPGTAAPFSPTASAVVAATVPEEAALRLGEAHEDWSEPVTPGPRERGPAARPSGPGQAPSAGPEGSLPSRGLREGGQGPVRVTVSAAPQVARRAAHGAPVLPRDGGVGSGTGMGMDPAPAAAGEGRSGDRAARRSTEEGAPLDGVFRAADPGMPGRAPVDRPMAAIANARRPSSDADREEPILRPALVEDPRPDAEPIAARPGGPASEPARRSMEPRLAIEAEPARLLARLDRGPDRRPGRRVHIGTVHVTVVRPAPTPARPPVVASPPAPEPQPRPAVWESPRDQDPWESAYRWVD